MIVKFIKNMLPYHEGEYAIFSDDKGQELIKLGVAVEVVQKKSAVAEKNKMVNDAKVEK